jgi:hypothetical protein
MLRSYVRTVNKYRDKTGCEMPQHLSVHVQLPENYVRFFLAFLYTMGDHNFNAMDTSGRGPFLVGAFKLINRRIENQREE